MFFWIQVGTNEHIGFRIKPGFESFTTYTSCGLEAGYISLQQANIILITHGYYESNEMVYIVKHIIINYIEVVINLYLNLVEFKLAM